MTAGISRLYERLGYAPGRIEEAEAFAPTDSYIRYDPSWAGELPDIPSGSIYDVFESSALAHPDRVAMVFLGRSFTYSELLELINRFAGFLQAHGVKKGDFIAPMLPSSAQHWIVFYAAARIGAVHAGVNVMYKPAEIERQLADCGAKVVVTLDLFLPQFESLRETLGLTTVVATRLQDLAGAGFTPYPALEPLWNSHGAASPDTCSFAEALKHDPCTTEGVTIDAAVDPAQIVYTAGTTGNSKGAVQTHRSLVFNSVTHSLACRTAAPPVNYTVLPMFHTGGFFLWALPAFYRGGTVIPSPIFDPADALRTIEAQRVTALFGPPTLYTALLRHPEFAQHSLSSLEVTACGAAPVPEGLAAAWEQQVGIPLHIGWGMTELNTMGTYNGLPGKPGPGTIGVPLVGEVKLVDENDCIVPRDTSGEILFRGLQTSVGYLNKPEETAATFLEGGWVRTGDLARMDDEGLLHFVDRKKDLIIASGYNVAPVEVEYAILEDSRVLDVAVVGVPDAYRGETVKAFVVPKPEFAATLSPEDVIAFCRSRLASYKAPTEVELRNELPKNALGKTLRRELRKESRR